MKKLKMKLQLFADDDGGAQNPDGNSGGAGKPDGNASEGETINKSELDSLVGKAVDTALKNNDKKWETKLADAKEAAKTEAEKYAKMTADEKAKADREKERKTFEEEKKTFEAEKLLVAVKSDLQKEKLPVAFADALVGISDAEAIKGAIEEIKKAWNDGITEAIKASARQTTPTESGQGAGDAFKPDLAKVAKEARIIK